MIPRPPLYCPHAPTERQTVALVAHHFLPNDEPSEVFYGGAAGGGKSDWLLMSALQFVDVPGYAAIIFRKTFTDLALPGAIMQRAHEWLDNSDAHWNAQKQWVFPSGAILQFAFMARPGDETRYQSAEFQFVGFDELTQFPEDQYTYLFSRLRRPELTDETQPSERRKIEALQSVPLRMCAASNPGNMGHGWVKARFPIDGKPRGKRVFVPAKIADNPHLDAVAYRAGLSRLGETLQKQLEDGDWDVAEGLAYQVGSDHLVEEFKLDDSIERFEACDYGLNGAPWALVAVDYEANLIFTDMLYEQGLLPSQLAPLVVEKRKSGWGFEHSAYADPSIWHRTGGVNRWGAPAVLADEFEDNGVPLLRANNDPRAGMIRLRELLRLDHGDTETERPPHFFPSWHPRAGEPGAPRVFFVRSTTALVQELQDAPLLPIDRADGGEKVDPEWESRHGHAAAMCRYAAMTRPAPSEAPPGPPPSDPREAALQEMFARERETDEELDAVGVEAL